MFKQNFEKCCAQIYDDANHRNAEKMDEIINDSYQTIVLQT